MKKALLITLFAIVFGSLAARAQGSGSYAGVSQCWDGRQWVTVNGNCPATGGGSGANSRNSPAANPALYNGFYQLGYQFGQWLFGGGSRSNAAEEALRQQQQQLMMAELRRREQEAEQQHREEEARRLAAMYNRLASTLKLVGLPHLQMKSSGTSVGGLQMKLGDNAQGYGIPGLPGIYVGGPGPGSGMTPKTPSTLKLKTGDDAMGAELAGNASSASHSPSDGQPGYGIPGLPGMYTGGPSSAPAVAPPAQPGLPMKMGDGGAAPTAPASASDPGAVDFNKMSPKQLADMADAFSKLPPEEQQRMMAAAQNPVAAPPQQTNATSRNGSSAQQTNPAPTPTPAPVMSPQTAAQPVASLQRQATASQAAATATAPEDASMKARAGFDTPLGTAPVQLGAASATPAILRSPGTTTAANRIPAASSSAQTPNPLRVSDDIKQFLFPGSQSTSPFPKDPNPPLTNPLREEARLQAELKRWDDWATQRATHLNDRPHDSWMAQPRATELALLNANAVKQYAPELLARYNSDTAFRQSVDLRLQFTNEHVALAYYQGLAEAHKVAIRAFQAELEKLAAAGTLDKLVPLEDQYRLHPERRQIVQSAWDRVSANEQSALANAQAEGSSKLDKEYQFAFQLIRGEAAQQR